MTSTQVARSVLVAALLSLTFTLATCVDSTNTEQASNPETPSATLDQSAASSFATRASANLPESLASTPATNSSAAAGSSTSSQARSRHEAARLNAKLFFPLGPSQADSWQATRDNLIHFRDLIVDDSTQTGTYNMITTILHFPFHENGYCRESRIRRIQHLQSFYPSSNVARLLQHLMDVQMINCMPLFNMQAIESFNMFPTEITQTIVSIVGNIDRQTSVQFNQDTFDEADRVRVEHGALVHTLTELLRDVTLDQSPLDTPEIGYYSIFYTRVVGPCSLFLDAMRYSLSKFNPISRQTFPLIVDDVLDLFVASEVCDEVVNGRVHIDTEVLAALQTRRSASLGTASQPMSSPSTPDTPQPTTRAPKRGLRQLLAGCTNLNCAQQPRVRE